LPSDVENGNLGKIQLKRQNSENITKKIISNFPKVFQKAKI